MEIIGDSRHWPVSYWLKEELLIRYHYKPPQQNLEDWNGKAAWTTVPPDGFVLTGEVSICKSLSNSRCLLDSQVVKAVCQIPAFDVEADGVYTGSR
jgi:hypothetical protein